jgi:outer membrane protein assembly factor BamB
MALILTAIAESDNWPGFRGPGSLGVAEDPNLPDTWSATENVTWKTEVPGEGWSSPAVWGDNIFVTSVIGSAEAEKPKKGLYFGGERKAPADIHRWMVYSVDFKTGKIRWEREVRKGPPESSHHLKNTYASESPVTDGERIYAYFGNVGVFCFDMNGKPLWSKNWGPFQTRYGWGTAASPVLHKDRIYMVNDNEQQSFIIALNKKTGEEIWRVERKEGSNWATPYIWENDLRTEIITPGTGKVRSYDLDGKLLWEFSGMSSIAIPTPFSRHGLVYIASGYVGDQNRPVYAVKPGASGDISLKQQVHRVVPATGWPVQSLAAGIRRLLLHTLRSRLLYLSRRQDRQRGLSQGANRSRGQRLHFVAVGLQRKDILPERGRRHVCHSGWSAIQGIGQEFSGRNVHGDAGNRAGQLDHSHCIEALSNHESAFRQAIVCKMQWEG